MAVIICQQFFTFPHKGGNASESTDEAPRENARVIPLQEMDSIVDADMAMLDNNRLHFYRRIDCESYL